MFFLFMTHWSGTLASWTTLHTSMCLVSVDIAVHLSTHCCSLVYKSSDMQFMQVVVQQPPRGPVNWNAHNNSVAAVAKLPENWQKGSVYVILGFAMPCLISSILCFLPAVICSLPAAIYACKVSHDVYCNPENSGSN